MVRNRMYEETELPIQNTYINGEAYIPFKFMNNIYPIDDIVSHHGKLYIRPLSMRELKELFLQEGKGFLLTNSEVKNIFKIQ